MAVASVVGLGRLTLSRRERMVAVEPRGAGMALFMLRAADEVRAAQFGGVERDLDAEMVAIARAIIGQRTGSFDPTTSSRPLPGGLARADRSQDEGAHGQTQG